LRRSFGFVFLMCVMQNLPERNAIVFPIGVAARAALILADDAARHGVLIGLIHKRAAFCADHGASGGH
jgi:hypothetical protein